MITTTASTRLYELAQIAAEKTQQRFKAAKFNAADELHSFNNNTNWDALNRKEFRDIMIRMESVTVQFYNDFGDCTYPSRHVAIKAFWANEWGCEYLPESGKWRDCDSGSIIKSETEKKAKRDAKKALKKDEKRKLKQHDEEDEAYAEAYAQARAEKDQALEQARAEQKAQAQAQNAQAQEQSKKQQQLDAEFDEEEDAWADAYAQAALARAEKEKAQQQQQQDEAQAYLDSFNYTSEEEQEEQEEPVTTRICCQAVLYIEELTETKGDPDWRAYIYYDARIRRYVLKGTRRSLRATSKKTVFPEIKLCFRSSRELAHYLCSSTDSLLNVSMLAMASATVRDATFAELYALPAHGCKTELFGYDETRPRYSTFVNYLCMVKDVDATHSTFASF
jgi:chemotaxis protein histidine kinase CheA